MKRLYKYLPEAPDLLAAREAEENAHREFSKWRKNWIGRWFFKEILANSSWTAFAPEAK